ncbi:threonyl-tRNA synthetase [mine drainage metagenome]|uniref:threonine--tRNA ligase n=3 Tax=mine drainage metagenome TaxID=410659 RepID=T1BUA4_9ZZZZ
MATLKVLSHDPKSFPVSSTAKDAFIDTFGLEESSGFVAALYNECLVDLSSPLDEDGTLNPVRPGEPLGLEVLRHSTAHLLAHAVKRMYPDVQVTIGPVIEDGFFYDFATQEAFSSEDLAKIEALMHAIAEENLPIVRQVVAREAAIRLFEQRGEHYKVEIINAIPATETLTLYRQGDFVDLCRGPHVPSTGFLQSFKLTKVAGAYWKGDSRKPMLSRIYGTAWATAADLTHYLQQLEEAEKRDHRRLAKLMDLFHFQDEAPGMVFWHEPGWTLYRVVENYIRSKLQGAGYQEVHTPLMLDRTLWERSGHAEKFATQMFTTASENREYAIKPMNCPAHVQIFNQGIRSYRDLPLRLAEFGVCHRNEPSGTLHGLLRARSFVQDDAHIFCSEDQVESEAAAFIRLLFEIYRDFGFKEIQVQLSTRPDQRVGEDALWDRAEQALAQALNREGLAFGIQPGEGAFYGPKIEFSLKDTLGRVWQCGTLQLDYFLPERLGASFIDAAGTKQPIIMLHRAILGSLERFIGILLEHYAGVLPLWLAPRQVAILTITSQQSDYASELAWVLEQKGYRVCLDLRNEKIGFKIRERTIQRIPYLAVVGPKEAASGQLAVRLHNGTDLGGLSLDNFIERLTVEQTRRGQDPMEG